MMDQNGLERRINDLLEGKPHAQEAVVDLLRNVDEQTWLKMSSHVEPIVRSCAIAAASTRHETSIRDRIVAMASDPSETVTSALVDLFSLNPKLEFNDDAINELLDKLREDDHIAKVLQNLGGRSAFTDRLLSVLEADSYPTEGAAATALRSADTFAIAQRLLIMLASRTYADQTLLRLIEHHYIANSVPFRLDLLTASQSATVIKWVKEGEEYCPSIHAAIGVSDAHDVDTSVLEQFGRVLSHSSATNQLPRAHLVDDAVQRITVRLLQQSGSRSAVLVGASGSGKTAIAHEVVRSLAESGWTVVEVVPTELLVGTKYLGEWETRLRRLIDAAGAPRKVLLYVPNVHELLTVGQSNNRDSSAAGMLAGEIERGDIVVLGESETSSYNKAMKGATGFRRLFAEFETTAASVDTTRELAQLVALDCGLTLTDEFTSQLIELSDGFVTGQERPGRAIGLLRRALEASAPEPSVRGLLEILSESTGAPVEFLDSSTPLDLPEVRRFFDSRVIGQSAAIDAVMDVITLIKAGLTDPNRPNGVLMFVGPTGVGKTELARALTKLLFGDESRLHRFDMSEFASYESYERLVGAKDGIGLLTETVRLQPFSVILLDEIEKAHTNVFDLCLQLFDAGRLTDGSGRTADFRNAVIIITSNVGSRVSTRPGAGFAGTIDVPGEASVQRGLEQTFRPEFLGRIDRIVTFKPLDTESAERIVRREITAVLRRSGITNRRIAVDVDPEVVTTLLALGYSQAFGARPLKRAIETHLLLPLAREIATGKIGSDSVIRLTADNQRIAMRVLEDRSVKPHPKPGRHDRNAATLGELRLVIDEHAMLLDQFAQEKSALLIRQSEPDFWSDRFEAFRCLDRAQRIDRLLAEVARLEREMERTERNPDVRMQSMYVVAHDRELVRLHTIITSGDLRDAAIVIERTGGSSELSAVEKLARMYAGFATRQRLESFAIDDQLTSEVDRIVLHVSGTGAYAMLQAETGLHRFIDVGGEHRRERSPEHASVEVLALEHDLPTAVAERFRLEMTKTVTGGRFGVRRAIRVSASDTRPTPGVRSSIAIHTALPSETARESVGLLLHGYQQRVPPQIELVRRYELGPSPVVVDVVRGTRTGRLHEVLSGSLELLDEESDR